MRVYIKKTVVESIVYIANNAFPKEFIGLLAGKIVKKYKKQQTVYINKLIIPSGSTSGEGFATYRVYRAPYDTIGTVHSHPFSPTPSFKDLNLFSYSGDVHIIIGRPYSYKNMRFYTNKGEIITNVSVVNDKKEVV
ncbi:Mov34/MPN/PAD-1 family protein [Candidatus Micrarchaeota archaeon]|nr:Mov34/MPN/PAD-1 family protein [Candidatus Micrarchaeota archaeon]